MVWLLWGLALAQVDVNAASVEQLDALPGLGPIKSRALAEWRAAGGRCRELEELSVVPSLGPGVVRGLRGRAVCGPGDPEPLPLAVHPVPPIYSVATVDLNRATAEGLLALPGMSLAKAERIVADREREGDYATCRDATRVPGIGPATIAVWGERCVAR
jgi:competence protein ComEA